MKGCNLSRARFQGAEIEQTMFSPDQIHDADFGIPNLSERPGKKTAYLRYGRAAAFGQVLDGACDASKAAKAANS